MKHTSNIVIIGANFAGLAAAKRLQGSADVTLIDPSPHFEFIPNIHELISGEKAPEDLRLDRGSLIQKMGHKWIQDRVTNLTPENNQLTLENGEVLTYDACIVTIGGVNNFHGVKGAEKFAQPFKSVDNCQKIGIRFQELKEADKPFSITIVGGGSEGVEALGELLRKSHRATPMRINVVEGNDHLLPGLSSKASKEIQRLCKGFPVDFHFNLRIKEVKKTMAVLSDESKLSSDLTIWTGGIRPHPMLKNSGLSNSQSDWAAVKPTLQSTMFDNVFIAGDAGDIDQVESKQAYFAMESGECAADNTLQFLQGKEGKDFHSMKKPYLYSFGDLSCFMIWNEYVLAGNSLSILKEGIYQKTMVDMQNLDTCDSISEIYDRAVPTVASGVKGFIESLLTSPLDTLSKAAVRLL